MQEEIFGPVLTIYVYDDAELDATLDLCDKTRPTPSPARCSRRTATPSPRLPGGCAHAAGNFYVNDKPTGAVVGQQPFGGARASGTNDKAGSL